MRDELRECFRRCVRQPKPELADFYEWHQSQADRLIAGLEGLMREHGLKMMARPVARDKVTQRQGRIMSELAHWNAAPLTPWEGEDGKN